ncbi:ornithine cyclodeaminase family protein [Paraburkholderia susongensis]|uniref:Ornithine cyclodeaminase n=1 Tax=Paraburkholderia susongensis TaxID=1515439 RepID=A0A1X7L5R7_9BURK|nr:ornithine cyclodeaminase family protein [Paraburkholderia susongensis]SMG48703.1 ornithine cyclodeaminase [Paraburkholderia susongensis]
MTITTRHQDLLLLDKHAVESLLSMDDALAATREAFVLHSRRQGRVFQVVRERLEGGGIFGIKSGDVQTQSLLGFKAAGFWPDNREIGGEPHQATIMLVDPLTGRPTCVIDGNAITTMRTGAAGGLGLELLARADSKTVCVFGTGVQARIQLTFALRIFSSIGKVRYVTSNGKDDEAFESLFRERCDISLALERNAAVEHSDIVITATPGRGPLFDANAVRPGTHLNCVGADTKGKRELPEGLLKRVRLFVDDAGQVAQIGEAQWAPDTRTIELGAVLDGKVRVERQREDITVFDMTGLALQDLTVASLLRERAAQKKLGTSIAWPW